MVVSQICIDLLGVNRYEYVVAKQGDVNSRLIQVQLLNNGRIHILDDQATARVSIIKPDKTEVLKDCTINNNSIEILMDANMLAQAGTAEAEIFVTESDGLVTSASFDIKIVAQNTAKNAESSNEYESFKIALVAADNLKNELIALKEGKADKSMIGSPLVAALVEEMTETDKVYVYVGEEENYDHGNWYYYNGAEWTSGGIYNSTAFATDETLTISGQAADAAVTGEKFSQLSEEIDDLGDGSLRNQKDGAILKIWVGTQDEYDAILVKDETMVYLIEGNGTSSGDSSGSEDTHTHSYISEITTEATCTTDGVMTYTCSCGDTYTEIISATGHNYVDGTCTVCGATDPDYNPEVTVTSISATYSGGEVYAGTSLNSLTGITVSATYSDGSTSEVTGYALTGEIAEGTNTITVTYNDLITAFEVTGIESPYDYMWYATSKELPTNMATKNTFYANEYDSETQSYFVTAPVLDFNYLGDAELIVNAKWHDNVFGTEPQILLKTSETSGFKLFPNNSAMNIYTNISGSNAQIFTMETNDFHEYKLRIEDGTCYLYIDGEFVAEGSGVTNNNYLAVTGISTDWNNLDNAIGLYIKYILFTKL